MSARRPDALDPPVARAIEADVRAELEAHIELAVEEGVAQGLAPEVARRRAEERFGDPERILRRCMKEKLGGAVVLQRWNFAVTLVLLALALVFGARSYTLLGRVAAAASTLEARVRALEDVRADAPTPGVVTVRIGDLLELRDEFHPDELNVVELVARDGTVLLPDLGHVPVAGLTREEVELLLRERYAEYYAHTRLWVVVREAGLTQLEEPTIRVGDRVELLDRHRQRDFHEGGRVQPDGTVLLMHLGRFRFAGLTRAEAEARLTEAFAPYFHEPLAIDLVLHPGG